MINGDPATAVNQEVESSCGPQQREFKAHFVPKKTTHSPALVVRYHEKNDDWAGNQPGEQSKREHRTSHELREDDSRRPEFSGTIAAAFEFIHDSVILCDCPPVDGNIPNALRNPCGTSISPAAARNNISAQGKSAW